MLVRPVAMILEMAVQYLLCRALTNFPGGARRHRARIDSVKITPRGEHVDASARRRAAGARRDKAAIERGEKRSAFRFPAAIDQFALVAQLRPPRCPYRHALAEGFG